MELNEIINSISPLPQESLAKLERETHEIRVRKNKIIVSADRVCNDVFFVADGIVRAFSYAEGKDITFWIGTEGSVALSMQSYINDRAGYENIVTLEDCRFFHLKISALRSLYATDIHLANWGRRFAENELLRTESILIPQLFTTGKERYETLMKNQPELLNRIPLENLASYLGLTPVSLSRIRGHISKGKSMS
ncbi:MAG: Crp/Fnr family transcriptional regulator [Bacteroides sp.]|nr:Crp/Fnr family transcriptional regulator [Bacteroides sp.]